MVKNVLITGASSGIGRATTELLASKGYNIFAIARNEKRLDEISGANINTLSADIATEDGRQAIKEFVGSTHLDLLINNAGLMAPSGNLSNVDLARWRYQIGVNVEAPLFLTQNLLENLSGGRVLNITIYSSFHVRPGLAAYGTSKAALNMLTE
jgi:benzil reductase ((S)-benzoin forming)